MARAGKDVAVSKGNLERMPRMLTNLDEMERLFDNFFTRRWMTPFSWDRKPGDATPLMPSVDVIDRDDEITVRAQLPGVKKDDVEVAVSGNLLTLKGEMKQEEKQEEGDYYRCEISQGSFARTLALPAEVDDSKAKASMHDGVLELTLPKVEASKRHTIKIE